MIIGHGETQNEEKDLPGVAIEQRKENRIKKLDISKSSSLTISRRLVIKATKHTQPEQFMEGNKGTRYKDSYVKEAAAESLQRPTGNYGPRSNHKD